MNKPGTGRTPEEDEAYAQGIVNGFDECIEGIKMVYGRNGNLPIWLVDHLEERKKFIASIHTKHSVSK
ncbi:hypothetical protein PP940_gp177 [Rhizobium phage RL2RES]|uniref:Uncharacterized protein n=1 Tax=Rhizobium phage RL2RES TaxID=103371 RepID=A0A6B9J6D8_9CAUD|nr:hypothetical protein PP940_gp177 [Rhizobium phage RL2RES]QGZ14335.1 hypothetical protein RL2RES_177 [Rhizobium phage RL2RES]